MPKEILNSCLFIVCFPVYHTLECIISVSVLSVCVWMCFISYIMCGCIICIYRLCSGGLYQDFVLFYFIVFMYGSIVYRVCLFVTFCVYTFCDCLLCRDFWEYRVSGNSVCFVCVYCMSIASVCIVCVFVYIIVNVSLNHVYMRNICICVFCKAAYMYLVCVFWICEFVCSVCVYLYVYRVCV